MERERERERLTSLFSTVNSCSSFEVRQRIALGSRAFSVAVVVVLPRIAVSPKKYPGLCLQMITSFWFGPVAEIWRHPETRIPKREPTVPSWITTSSFLYCKILALEATTFIFDSSRSLRGSCGGRGDREEREVRVNHTAGVFSGAKAGQGRIGKVRIIWVSGTKDVRENKQRGF